MLEAVARWLDRHPALRTIATFSALPGEPDLSDLPRLHRDRRWVYPRVVGDALVFHIVENPATDLERGTFGILEPSPALAVVPVDAIDAFLCPGLAFDGRGGRLGRGKGFYDRMLSTARPNALKVGVCFSDQIVPDTFPEGHDIPMDEIISA